MVDHHFGRRKQQLQAVVSGVDMSKKHAHCPSYYWLSQVSLWPQTLILIVVTYVIPLHVVIRFGSSCCYNTKPGQFIARRLVLGGLAGSSLNEGQISILQATQTS